MCNLNTVAQILRVILGIILLSLVWLGPQTHLLGFEWLKLWNLGWLGIIPLTSGITAFCPIYAVLGCGHQNEKK